MTDRVCGLEARREDRSLRASLHAELGEQVRHVVLDRLLGQVQLVGDLPVGEPVGDEGEDLALLPGEARQALVFHGRAPQPLGDPLGDHRIQQRLTPRHPVGPRRRCRSPGSA